MHRSTDHILVSHVGRLPDPKYLEELLKAGSEKREEFVATLPRAVTEVVNLQIDAGVDVVNDGELGKVGEWSGYIRERVSGFETRVIDHEPPIGRVEKNFPEYSVGRMGGPRPAGSPPPTQMFCVGPVEYIGLAEIQRDIANLKAAVAGKSVADVFMAAIGPDNLAADPGSNEYYKDDAEYLAAKAMALRTEYQAIVDAGFILQLDMPVFKYNGLSLTLEDFRNRWAVLVDAVNVALEGISPEQVRVHVCYGSGINGHTGDLSLDQIIDLVLKINANAFSYDQNVRHEHEWTMFRDFKLPEGKILMPGVVSHFTDVVEHPQLIAQRIVRLAELVGRENVIAGTDCGLGRRLHREIAWAKLVSAGEGARLASKELWG